MSARPAEQGFSLIEMLVALAVFSLAAVALVNLAGENARSASVIEARTLAAVVAENQAVETLTAPAVVLGEASGAETQAGREWLWTRKVSPTDNPGLLRVDIAVRGEDSAQTLASLTLFRGRT